MDYEVFESRILELAYKTDSQLTSQLAAYKVGCTVDQARTFLEAMAANAVLNMDVDDSGMVLFNLPGRPPPSGEPLTWAQGTGQVPTSLETQRVVQQPSHHIQGALHSSAPASAYPQPAVGQMHAPNGFNQHQQFQVNVAAPVIIGAHKSVFLAVILAFFFGPLGMFYSTVAGGLIMLLLTFIVVPLTLGLGLLVLIPMNLVWAGLAASSSNRRLLSAASPR